jgi:hypothetical protein
VVSETPETRVPTLDGRTMIRGTVRCGMFKSQWPVDHSLITGKLRGNLSKKRVNFGQRTNSKTKQNK